MLRRVSLAVLPAVALALFACQAELPIPQQVMDCAPRAEFIFAGTVEIMNSSTLLAGDVDDLAVVRVDQILRGPPIFDRQAGNQLTVKLKSPGQIKDGEQWLFYTNGWLFSDSVAVTETCSARLEEGGESLERVQNQVEAAMRDKDEAELGERLAAASVVLVAKVVAVERDPKAEPMVTEHDPEWWLVRFEVETVLKGSASEGEPFTAAFANSNDVLWADAPKPKEGDQGVWLLHADLEAGPSPPRPALLKPEDARSREDLNLIQRLLDR